MKILGIPALVITLALLLLAQNPATAKGSSKGKHLKPTPVPEKINAKDARIERVSNDSITVKSSKTTETYKINGRTQIQVNGARATTNDLRAGMQVEVDASKIDIGSAMFIKAQSAAGK